MINVIRKITCFFKGHLWNRFIADHKEGPDLTLRPIYKESCLRCGKVR